MTSLRKMVAKQLVSNGNDSSIVGAAVFPPPQSAINRTPCASAHAHNLAEYVGKGRQ